MKALIKKAFDFTAGTFGPHNRKANAPQLWVLMYHRILPEIDERYHLEEPGMIVTPETLEMHIIEAKKLFTVISLNDWVDRFKTNQPLPDKACALTFDDGWLDNAQYAAPILEKHKVPATIFAVVDKIGTDFRFWPNIIAELVSNQYPGLSQHPMFKEAEKLSKSSFSKENLAVVILELKKHSEESIFSALEEIGWRLGIKEGSKAIMNWDQLLSSPFEVGCHTNTHRRLTTWLDDESLRYEICDSMETLSKRAIEAKSLFCYPNGDYSEHALALVRNQYKAAVTTKRGINHLETLDLHQLKRIPLHNDISNTPISFRARLSTWKAL